MYFEFIYCFFFYENPLSVFIFMYLGDFCFVAFWLEGLACHSFCRPTRIKVRKSANDGLHGIPFNVKHVWMTLYEPFVETISEHRQIQGEMEWSGSWLSVSVGRLFAVARDGARLMGPLNLSP